MSRKMMVDEKCYELAEHFMADLRITNLRNPTPEEISALAEAIQQVCEDHFLDASTGAPVHSESTS